MDTIERDREINALGAHVEELAGMYSGGPRPYFTEAGRDTMIALLLSGLHPRHTLLDFGSGAFRLGYWLIRLLEPGHYYALDPEQKMVDAGRKVLFDDYLWSYKRPTVAISGNCDMTRFGVKFDYVVARSVLTHTTPGMLRKILSEFHATSAPIGQFIASYWPATGPDACPFDGELCDILPPDDWRFINVAKYSFAAMTRLAREAGLKVEEFYPASRLSHQVWLRFTKSI